MRRFLNKYFYVDKNFDVFGGTAMLLFAFSVLALFLILGTA